MVDLVESNGKEELGWTQGSHMKEYPSSEVESNGKEDLG